MSHFMIQKSILHVSSIDLEGRGQLSSNIMSCGLKELQGLRVPFWDRAIIALSFVSYSSGRMTRDKKGERVKAPELSDSAPPNAVVLPECARP